MAWTSDGLLSTVADDDAAWDAGITETEAFYLPKYPPYVEENRQLWKSGRDKLRAAFKDTPQ